MTHLQKSLISSPRLLHEKVIRQGSYSNFAVNVTSGCEHLSAVMAIYSFHSCANTTRDRCSHGIDLVSSSLDLKHDKCNPIKGCQSRTFTHFWVLRNTNFISGTTACALMSDRGYLLIQAFFLLGICYDPNLSKL